MTIGGGGPVLSMFEMLRSNANLLHFSVKKNGEEFPEFLASSMAGFFR